MRQQFDDNYQIQKYCADFINKFISKYLFYISEQYYIISLDRIRSHIYDLQSGNEEEVLIQLNGLKQVCA